MKIKKFVAQTEQAAIQQVKNALGSDALVINIKTIQPKGFLAVLKKPYVEVLAAYEEGKAENNQASAPSVSPDLPAAKFEPLKNQGEKFLESLKKFDERFEERLEQDAAQNEKNQSIPANFTEEVLKQDSRDELIASQDEKIKRLEEMLLTTSDMLSSAQRQLKVTRHKPIEHRRYQNNLVQIFYDALKENQVSPEIAEEILDELDSIKDSENLDINFIVKIVYNSIMSIIGEPMPLTPTASKGEPKVLAFMGPTGVGKTTTIAKLTADFSLNRNLDVGLITADTYRIAAIEQLKTYGDILRIEVAVAYKPTDLTTYVHTSKNIYDIILMDTAGRSHKNKENLMELKEYLDAVENAEKFLVLSLTTKFEDMLDIVETYSSVCDFKIIFTKMDETSNIGSILNICHKTGKKLSYITFGQNVPDDIKTIKPDELAQKLLGLENEE